MVPTDCTSVQVIPLIILGQFSTIQNLLKSPIPPTSNWSVTFFATLYDKPALKAGSAELCMVPSAPLILVEIDENISIKMPCITTCTLQFFRYSADTEKKD